MRHIRTARPQGFFRVVAQTPRSQAATMVLRPGRATGDEENVHPRSDQWLYVVSGSGQATVNRRRVRLRQGSLLLIEAKETHEIRNTGRQSLVTINVYSPPAY